MRGCRSDIIDACAGNNNINKEEAAALVESGLSAIHDWSQRMKLSLNPSKCETGFFSSNTQEAAWVPVVEVDGHRLRHNKNPVFLGVTFDRSLSFNGQLSKVCTKTVSGMRILSVLTNSRWGWNKAAVRAMYCALCRSVMDYSAAAWQPWLARTAMEKMERCQNKALRTTMKTTSGESCQSSYGQSQ